MAGKHRLKCISSTFLLIKWDIFLNCEIENNGGSVVAQKQSKVFLVIWNVTSVNDYYILFAYFLVFYVFF